MKLTAKQKILIRSAATHYYDIQYYANAMGQKLNHEVALDIVCERYKSVDRDTLNDYLYGFITF